MDRAAASMRPNMFPGFPWFDGAGTGAFAGLRDFMQLALADDLSSNTSSLTPNIRYVQKPKTCELAWLIGDDALNLHTPE